MSSINRNDSGCLGEAFVPVRFGLLPQKRDSVDSRINVCVGLVCAAVLLGCVSAGGPVNLRGDAWQVTAIDYTAFGAARVGLAQANDFCAKRGQSAFIAIERTNADMPAHHIYTIDFQCTARGNSPEANAEYRMRNFQRDCAIAGFDLGSPENIQCANTLAEKASPKTGAPPRKGAAPVDSPPRN